jgi:hypothetical protein
MASRTKKEVLRSVLCMDALGFFIFWAVIALLWVHLENTEVMKRWVWIMIGVWLLVWFFLSSLLEERRELVKNWFVQRCIS